MEFGTAGTGRYFAIRQCGYGNWAYCDGNCYACRGNIIETSDHTEPIKADYYSSSPTGHNGVYIFGKQKPNSEDIGVADANRIAEAAERIKKYKRE